MDATFYGPSAKSRILRTELLDHRVMEDLINAENYSDLLRILNSTPYGNYIQSLSTLYSSYELLELAADSRMFEVVMKIVEAPPASARETIKSYISRWDIESIKSIITAKFLGRELKNRDLLIIDQKNYPLGLMGNLLSREDYSLIMNESDVEGVSKYLVKLGYGIYLMRYMDEYRKERDVSVLLYSLDVAYYERLVASVKYFLGNEAPMRDFVRDQIDLKNLLTIMKGKDLLLDYESLTGGIIQGGRLGEEKLREIFSSDGTVRQRSLSSFGVEKIPEGAITMGETEILLRKELYRKTMERFSVQANSLGSIFLTILKYEIERNNLRIIFAGKAYDLSPESIRRMIL